MNPLANRAILAQAISTRKPTRTQLARRTTLAIETGHKPPRLRATPKVSRPAASTDADPRRARAIDLVNELDWVLGTDSADSIARRLGYTSVAGLRHRLIVLGRRYPDLHPRTEQLRQKLSDPRGALAA